MQISYISHREAYLGCRSADRISVIHIFVLLGMDSFVPSSRTTVDVSCS
jgi:hypothetical protein